jgi:alpha-galactosidase
MKFSRLALFATFANFANFAVPSQAAEKAIKVFILAGQSNMEGKAKVTLLDYQVAQPATRPLFAHFQKDGKWAERDDVWIKFLDRQGKLTVGYGSPKCLGPELQFGWTIGDRFEEPVILIKAAWGGRSLLRDFRPPSAGLPPDAALQKLLSDQQKKKPETTLDDVKKPFGASYRAMLEEVQGVLKNPKSVFPAYAGQSLELAGFVWFQGWNDMISKDSTAEYAANMAHFIRDVRKDLGVAKLPFVIAQMGVDGPNPGKNIQTFKTAQGAAAELPEFAGNVALVKTDAFWDMEADAIFRKGWRENLEEWNKVGSDFPYHYLGSAKTLCAIGKACAEAVLALSEKK